MLGGEVRRVSAKGGTPEILVKGLTSYSPQLLPDGKTLLFTTVEGSDTQTAVQSLESGKRKKLFAGLAGQYLSTGHIVYGLNDNLYAVPFDLDKMDVTGGAVPVIEGLMRYVVSNSGALVYIPPPTSSGSSGSAGTPQRSLVWVDRKGNEEPLRAASNNYHFCKISPDGTRVAYSAETGTNEDIWILDIARNAPMRLTFDETADSLPHWTSDGKHVVYFSIPDPGIGRILRKAADGTGEMETLGSETGSTQDLRSLIPSSWSADGKALILSEVTVSPLQSDIGMLSMEGNHERKVLLQGKFSELAPQISPDGRWIAYQSDESGRLEIFVRPFPEVNKGRWQVSDGGGSTPLWSHDGRELFYRDGDAVMAVAVETAAAFRPGNPIKLFQGKYFSVNSWTPALTFPCWDISPDGKRFLFIKSAETTAGAATADQSTEENPRKIIVVLNWLEELKTRVPVQ